MSQRIRQINLKLLRLQEYIRMYFTKSDWIKIGYLTDCQELVEGHPRLLRSLDFRDEDYEGNILQVLSRMVDENSRNLAEIERYVEASKNKRRQIEQQFISTVHPRTPERVVTFAPDVFRVPDKPVEANLLSVMMPFEGKFSGTYTAIRNVCNRLGVNCRRADDIWNNSILIQDIFDLIFVSKAVITDFTGRNPNVFYETGIAHSLGKVVIPITQAIADIPFDLRHHRALTYLPNGEGLIKLEEDLERKLRTVFFG